MKILIAPSAIGGLGSVRTAAIIEAAARCVFNGSEIISFPLPASGRGLIDAFEAMYSGKRVNLEITSPDGETGNAEYLRAGDIAVIEAPGGEFADRAYLSSCGTGEIIRDALENGAAEIVIGADTNAAADAGMGMLQALGAVFLSKSGKALDGMGAFLSRIEKADLSGLTPLLSGARITVVSDSSLRLNAIPEARRLSSGYDNFVSKLYDECGCDIGSFEGSGAGGGLAAALCGMLRAEYATNADVVLEFGGFDEELTSADILITACEHSGDRNTAELLKRCSDSGVPCFILTCAKTREYENAVTFPIVNAPMSWDNALLQAESLLAESSARLMKTLTALRR